jgi:hypothetical protein
MDSEQVTGNPADGTVHSRRRRPTRVTVPAPALPAKEHPIWSMGHEHVKVAHAVCSFIYALVVIWPQPAPVTLWDHTIDRLIR